MRKMICIHHTDLDGIGVRVLTQYYAQAKVIDIGEDLEFIPYMCNYHTIDKTIEKIFKENNYKDIYEIIIGDIAPYKKGTGAELLEKFHQHSGRIHLGDHHKTAEWLNKYDWAYVSETDENNVLRCGTYIIYNTLRSQLSTFTSQALFNSEIIKTFVTEVDNYDTWKWVAQNDIKAQDLNGLFQILGVNDFTRYMMELFNKNAIVYGTPHPTELFTDTSRVYVDAYRRMLMKKASSCERNMWVSVMEYQGKSYSMGLIFADSDISDISEIILQRKPYIDILFIASLPRTISYRTSKELNIELGTLAKIVTGSGGGHPQAAASTISVQQFKKLFYKAINELSEHFGLDYSYSNLQWVGEFK